MIKNFDIKPYFTEEEIQAKIGDLALKLNEKYKGEEVYIVSVLKGSVMFAVDLAKRLTMPVKMEFVKVSSYGSGTQSSGQVNAQEFALPDLNDKNVIVAEDIIDTGYTAKFLVDLLKNKFKMKSFLFCSLLNKKARRKVDIDADYYCFDVEDKFLVGYGMDYNGQFRNLPYVGYIEL